MSRIKNYEDEKERLDAMSVDEPLWLNYQADRRCRKTTNLMYIDIKRNKNVSHCGDIYGFNDDNGDLIWKVDYEMTDADWGRIHRK